MIQFEPEMLLPDLRLPQDYILRYISYETQLRGSQHLHDFIRDSLAPHGHFNNNGSDNADLPEPCPEPPCRSYSAVHFLDDNSHIMLEDPVNNDLDLPDLVSEDSNDD